MSGWQRTLAVAAIGALLVAGRGRLARFARTVDQRAGIFAPHGAGLYNAVAPSLLRPLYRRVAADVARTSGMAEVPEISAVIELGSGPGELALEIARQVPGCEVVGIDLAEPMVARATEAAAAARLGDRVTFQVADVAALPLAAGTFDVAVSTLSLHHWSDPAAVFVEVARVLRPGGLALIYDLRPFAYTTPELEVFLAGGPFETAPLDRGPAGAALLGTVFVRIRLVRPANR